MDNVIAARLRVEAAELRVLATKQRDNAAAHYRQAAHPVYTGQTEICMSKGAQIETYAARSEARAAFLEVQANELT